VDRFLKEPGDEEMAEQRHISMPHKIAYTNNLYDISKIPSP
jgi:hypothetical protein